MDKITKVCDDCYGEGTVSSCCSGEMDEGRCTSCGRFASEDACCACSGYGLEEFKVGVEADFFVCVWNMNDSPLHEKVLKKHNLIRDASIKGVNSVSLRVEVRKIINPHTVLCKVEGIRGLQEIGIEHLEIT